MKYYFQEKQAVMKALQSSESGLKASEVEKRLGTYGKNKLAEGKKTSLFARFLKQLADPMILVLLVSHLPMQANLLQMCLLSCSLLC